ncbi:uncharacterized protein LOC129762763 [Toxorhynchites rutilus septentrionalis]|uniref:uncharacterized protein LOC129762763 n=1 Tax=Toxorhynchites rutilus septentrionalis TaxID=329112 RepID=UPI002478CA28|nr:uncharacterized protein LOC129762763 [Toxorhynchites rutilus septentrionalis]
MYPLKDIFTFYNATTKVWSGRPTPSVFNPNQSLGELIFAVLKRNGKKVVQISADSGAQVTGAEMVLRTIRLAQNLQKRGLCCDGDNMFAMAVRNGEHAAPVLFSCFALGIPVLALDPTFLRDDLSYMLEIVRPKVVFCDSETLAEMLVACEMVSLTPKIIVLGDKVEGFEHVDDLLLPTGNEEVFIPVHLEDPPKKLAILICTSGTTGRSKAVCLSHTICIVQVANFAELHSSDKLFAFSSLYWLSGLTMVLGGTIWGTTRVITRQMPSPELAMEIIERFQVSVAFFPPVHAFAIVKNPLALETVFSSIRMIHCGGALVPAQLKESFEKLMPGRYMEVVYGLSEIATLVSFSNGKHYRPGSVGFLKEGIEIKIVDDEGNPLENGQQGEICTKAKYMFLGYYKNEAATKATLDEEGWLHTGDIGWCDDDGMLYVVDRKKDVLTYDNYQISPSEIESVVLKVPGVATACVVGIPEQGDDLVTAVVIRSSGEHELPTAESIIRTVEEKMPYYKHIRGGVYFVENLPMTPSGKISRREAKKMVLKIMCK